jgi:hypothetical protein
MIRMKNFKWVTVDKEYEYDSFEQSGVLWHIVNEVGDGEIDIVEDINFEVWKEYRKDKTRMRCETLERRSRYVFEFIGEPDEDGDYEKCRFVGFDI